MLTFFQNLLNLSGTVKTSAVVGLVSFCLGVIFGVIIARPQVVINKDKAPIMRDGDGVKTGSPLPSGGSPSSPQ